MKSNEVSLGKEPLLLPVTEYKGAIFINDQLKGQLQLLSER